MPRNFPDLISAYLEYAEGQESTDRIRKWSFISILAACLERRVYMDMGDYYHLYCNLYVFLIAKSGVIKKTTSSALAVDLVRSFSGMRIMAERLTAASLISQLAKSGKTFECSGKIVRQSPVFAYAPELAVFMTEVFGSITELLTTFYDSRPDQKHGKDNPWVNETIKGGRIEIHGPLLNILGASTKAWLRKCIPNSEKEGGFTSRIVFVVENGLPDKWIPWPQKKPGTELYEEKIIEDLLQVFSLIGEMKPTPEAKELFSRWYISHQTNVADRNQDARMSGYFNRKGDSVRKLAMIRSASQRNDLLVTEDDMRWACRELNALELDWRTAFDQVIPLSGVEYEIYELMHQKTMIRKKDIFLHFDKIPVMNVMQALHTLKGMGEIIECKKPLGLSKEKIEYYALPGWEGNWEKTRN